MAKLGAPSPKPAGPGGPSDLRSDPGRPAPSAPAGPAVKPAPAPAPQSRAAFGKLLDNRRDPRGGAQDPEVVSGRALIGDESLDAQGVGGMSVLHAAEHVMILLSRKRAKHERDEALAVVGDLILGLEQPAFAKKVLLGLGEVGRIVDIYPLEVLAYVMARRPALAEGIRFEPFVKNRSALESAVHVVESPIAIQIPLPMKMRAFALSGGGSPGYCFTPGAPGEYHLELGEAGQFTLLLRGEVHKAGLVDRLKLRVTDEPGSD